MSIELTEAASTELKNLIESEQKKESIGPEAGLRVMVVGGGCSGFTYRMGFDETVTERDNVYEVDGIRVIVDEKSLLYMKGTQIDYHDGLMGRGFVFNNPNATGKCGCGSSFSA